MKFEKKEDGEGAQRFAREMTAVVSHINSMAQNGTEDEHLAVLHLSAMAHNCATCEVTECEKHGKAEPDGAEGKSMLGGFIGDQKTIAHMVAVLASKDMQVYKTLLRGIVMAARKDDAMKLLLHLEVITL
jgi:hypothetical protein